jgi:hypothetical protein
MRIRYPSSSLLLLLVSLAVLAAGVETASIETEDSGEDRRWNEETTAAAEKDEDNGLTIKRKLNALDFFFGGGAPPVSYPQPQYPGGYPYYPPSGYPGYQQQPYNPYPPPQYPSYPQPNPYPPPQYPSYPQPSPQYPVETALPTFLPTPRPTPDPTPG